MPEKESSDFASWRKCDFMVTSWILNSISKELEEAFIYIASTKELWDKIAERYDESNGPLIFQIQREINSSIQGDDESISMYFIKLKKL